MNNRNRKQKTIQSTENKRCIKDKNRVRETKQKQQNTKQKINKQNWQE